MWAGPGQRKERGRGGPVQGLRPTGVSGVSPRHKRPGAGGLLRCLAPLVPGWGIHPRPPAPHRPPQPRGVHPGQGSRPPPAHPLKDARGRGRAHPPRPPRPAPRSPTWPSPWRPRPPAQPGSESREGSPGLGLEAARRPETPGPVPMAAGGSGGLRRPPDKARSPASCHCAAAPAR